MARTRAMRIRIDNRSLHYLVAGTGFPLVLIHGLGRDLSTWSAQIPVFSEKYKVVAYDVRGFGQSDKGEEHSFESWVEDLYQLLRALDIDHAYLLGTSMGGMIAMHFAVKHPEIVKALIVANSSCRLPDQSIRLLNTRAELIEQNGMECIAEASIAGSFTPDFIQSNAEVIRKEREAILRNDPQVFAAVSRVIARMDLTNQMGRIACPTLIIAGEEDAAAPQDTAQAICNQVPFSRLKVLPKCRHLSYIEQTEAFNTAVLEFLASLEG